MISEREAINGIHTFGLNRIPAEQIEHAASVFGSRFMEPADLETRRKAREYLHGPLKRILDWGLATVIYTSYAKEAEGWVTGIEKIDPSCKGTINLDVAFFPEQKRTRIRKIRTMWDGSYESGGFFDVASVVSDHKYVEERILPGDLPKDLRKWKDEFYQLLLVISGKMSLTGCRAFHSRELDVNAVLTQYRNHPEVSNDAQMSYVLANHDEIVSSQGILPSIVNLRGILIPHLTSHGLRMLLNIRYAEHASPATDSKLIYHAFKNRFLGVEKGI